MAREIPVPKYRRPTTPGETLREEFMEPLKLTKQILADALGIDRPALNAILNGRRAVTAQIALRLERVFGMSACFWLGLQEGVDLWDALHDPKTKREISRLKPIIRRPVAKTTTL